jgi:ATP adenylyltransferase
MERLWAPWRIKYISGQVGKPSDGGCVFCEAPEANDDVERLILARGETTFTIMNLFPYTNGHLMVVPYRHVAVMSDLSADEHTEIMSASSVAVEVLGATMNCDGYNIGMNIGRAAGAGIDTHLHMHVVPRWNGDTNFMPVLNDTRIVSESLEDAYRKLKAEYDARNTTA